MDKKRDGIVMFEPDMHKGTEFQIMQRSLGLEYIAPNIENLFNGLGDREPVFAVYIDCAAPVWTFQQGRIFAAILGACA